MLNKLSVASTLIAGSALLVLLLAERLRVPSGADAAALRAAIEDAS